MDDGTDVLHAGPLRPPLRIGIVGAGIAGPTLAHWLRRYGHAPVLFEQAPEPRTGGYVIDFWGLGYDIAEQMGVLPAVHDRCYRMDRLRMVDADGREIVGLDVGLMRDALDGRFVSIARSDLAGALLDACDGVPMRFGVSVDRLDQDTDGVTLTLTDGSTERFDLVVGADGLHSRVRALAFPDVAGTEVPLGCHVAACRLRGYPRRDDGVYVSYTVPGLHVARVSLRDDETLVLFVCLSDRIDATAPIPAALRAAFGGMGWEVPALLDRMEASPDLYADDVRQIHLPTWSNGRVALVGDAAACASLLAGEGTGLAMIEAYVLAGELHARADVAAAFTAYHDRLGPFVAAKQRAAPQLRGFFTPGSGLGLVARNAMVRLLGLPFVGPRLVARSLRDDLVLPAY